MVLSLFKTLDSDRMIRYPLIVAAILVLSALFSSAVQARSVEELGGEAAAPLNNKIADTAVSWLVTTHQNEDGGYTSFSLASGAAPSDVSGTADALIALGAVGEDVTAPLNYLENQVDELRAFAEIDGSTTGKVVLALNAAGEDPRDFEMDFVEILLSHLSADGDFGVDNAFGNSTAVLALEAAGEPIPEGTISWLRGHQESEGEFSGSWDDGFGTEGNPDATAMAIMALLASGIDSSDEALINAESFLSRSQLESGGWEYGSGFGENANSIALVIRALVALGHDPTDENGDFAQSGKAPFEALLAWQGESGALQADFGEGPADDFFATVQSIPAVADVDALGAESDSGIFGGDSILPYLMLGLVAFVFIVLVVWYVRASRSGT